MKPRRSKILQYELPADHAGRIEELRDIAGDLPYHQRYLSGQFREIWAELDDLGDAVMFDPICIDALAVAYETMHRAKANIKTLLDRLVSAGYEFDTTIYSPYWTTSQADERMAQMFERSMRRVIGLADGAAQPDDIPENLQFMWEADRRQTMEQIVASQQRRQGITQPLTPPHKTVELQIRRIEAVAGQMPVSLHAWYNTINGVNFAGAHTLFAPKNAITDPLFIAPLQFVLDAFQAWREKHAGEDDPPDFEIPISLTAFAKARKEATDPLVTSTLPCTLTDTRLHGAGGLTFVNYLRRAFEWGGFPGWQYYSERPTEELQSLREGLLPL